MWSVLTRTPGARAAARGAHSRPPAAAARDRRRPRDRDERRRRGMGRPTSSASARASSRRASPSRREHVAAVPARGAAVARGDLPEPRRRVRRGHAQEARGCTARDARRDRGRLPRDRGMAALRAGRRSLREPVLRDRATRRGRGRARGPAAAHVVPALGEPDRLGRARDREHAARRAARRGRARPPASPGNAARTYALVRAVPR